MHDFGEYLPFDAVLFSGESPITAHTNYVALYSQVVAEALAEVEGGDEIVYFMRASTGQSAKNTRLYWMGDQLTSYDSFDGLNSALIGLMNSGMSGMSLGHSDIGGYTVVNEPLIEKFVRSQELLQRWIEMNTFSDPMMRSHPSSDPGACAQIYNDDDNILFMKKFTEVHVDLAGYKSQLMQEAWIYGRPFTRHPMLHYPNS